MSEQADAVHRWLAKAEEDIQLARRALDPEAPLTAGACFHCQQAAEKYLKAVLVQLNIEFPRTHDLAELVRLVASEFPEVSHLREKADLLSEYAVEIRYPDAAYTPSETEAREALEAAMDIKGFCLTRLDPSQ